MTTEHVIQFFAQQPFVPFILCLVNGGELQVQHPETAMLGRAGLAVYFFHPNGQVEFIDTALIVSIRTLYAADIDELTR